MNNMHVIQMIPWFIFQKLIALGILVSVLLTVWEDNDGSEKQYMCAMAIYVMKVLSSLYGIIMDREINAPGNGKNVADGH